MSTDHEKDFDDQDFEDVAGVDDGIPDDAEPATEPVKFSLDIVNTKPSANLMLWK